MSDTALTEFLTWDSEFFGRRIARSTVEQVNADQMQQILAWCQQERIECLYFLADPADNETLRQLQQPLFRLVDLRMTLAFDHAGSPPLQPAPSVPDVTLRAWQPADLPELIAVARSSYTDSRFYFDGHFPIEHCAQLYETWLIKSCDGWADHVLVAEIEGRPVGFITGHLNAQAGRIGLVGVAQTARGYGVGQHLVTAMLAWFQQHDCQQTTVITQGRNIPAQRLYQRCGFLSHTIRLWYHGWF